MSEYTPIDADIRTAWMVHHIDGTNESPMPMNEWESEFDRWLTEHDRQVAERAWEEGARWAAVEFGKDASMDEIRVGLVPSDNPYRKEQEEK